MDFRGKVARTLIAAVAAVLAALVPAFGAEPGPSDYVAVYYFHGNLRCVNCFNIEKYTKEALDEYFRKEMDSGKVVFKIINVDTKGNSHFIDDYQLYTKSDVLSLVKSGKEVRFENLVKVWEYLRDSSAFRRYIKSEVEKYLKET